MSLNWADECDNSTSVEDFLASFTPTQGVKHLRTEADHLFADIVEEEDKFSLSRVWLPLHSTEDDIYYQLLCVQIAHAEALDIARATVFDSQSSISGQIHLPEPNYDLLQFFVPEDIANYSTPVTSAQPSQKMSPGGWNWGASKRTGRPTHVRDLATLPRPQPHRRGAVPVGGPRRPKNRSTQSRASYGVDPLALSVARDYMNRHGNTARHITQRMALESDICAKMPGHWSPFPRPNKIIFALAHGLKLLRVRGGSTLEWNRFRDNHGNKLR